MTTINTVADFQAALDDGAFAWPGGYPKYFITSDGAALSYTAAIACASEIMEAIELKLSCGWRVVAVDVNWENEDLVCDHTGEPIECAYPQD